MKAKQKAFEEFIERVKKIKGVHIDMYPPDDSSSYYCRPKDWKEVREKLKGHYISVRWRTGGVSGGSCWDTGEEDCHYPVSGDPEPEFEDLDLILEVLCPQITFLQYKKFNDIIERKDWTDNEYYGNSSSYSTKYINLKSLFEKLKELGLI